MTDSTDAPCIDPTEAYHTIGDLNGIAAAAGPGLTDEELATLNRAAELLEEAAGIEYGKRVMESELTGETYRVTAWVERGEGKFIALQKEPVEEAQS